jgi:flap endonuclease-1
MGIKGLPKLIWDKAGTYAVGSYKFQRFKGFTVAVDASLIIHQTVIAMRSTGRDMKNKRGELTSHLHGLFYKILIFLQNHMRPIFVFDGKAPDIKNKTLKRRLEKKAKAEKQIEKLAEKQPDKTVDSEDEEYIKNFKQTFKPTKDNIKESMTLLDLMGIPYIVAPGEADVVCAWLCARHDPDGKRYAKGVCSDDSDILALGAPYLFKDMLRYMNQNKDVKVISLHRALTKMNITMEQFTDLCVLLGCDYCDNIKGIGSKRAYELIKKHGSLEKVLTYLNKNKVDSDNDSNSNGEEKTNEECMIDARNYFRNALAEIDNSEDFVLTDDNLKLKQYQYEELMDFMCIKHDFDVTRIQNGIDRLKEYYKQMDVTRENKKFVHKIIQPRSENYIVKMADENSIEFRSSDEETIPSKKLPSKKIFMKKSKPVAPDSDNEDSPPTKKTLLKRVAIKKPAAQVSDDDKNNSDISVSNSDLEACEN